MENSKNTIKPFTNKTIPSVSSKDGICGFSGVVSLPKNISRKEAAETLLAMREYAKNGIGRITRNGTGKYTLVALNSIQLETK